MAKILIVDDEELLVKGLKRSLEAAGFETDTAYNGSQALEKSLNQPFDLIILDLMLPEIDGFEVFRRVRQVSQIPIIMVTARVKMWTKSSAWNWAQTTIWLNLSIPGN